MQNYKRNGHHRRNHSDIEVEEAKAVQTRDWQASKWAAGSIGALDWLWCIVPLSVDTHLMYHSAQLMQHRHTLD